MVKKIAEILASLWPSGISICHKLQYTQREFYSICSFPRVMTVVDRTLIKIQFFLWEIFALNDYTYDGIVFSHLNACLQFGRGYNVDAIIRRDSGYPLKWLIPLGNPQNEAEAIYSQTFTRTRTIIKRRFEIYKRTFPTINIRARCYVSSIQKFIVTAAIRRKN